MKRIALFKRLALFICVVMLMCMLPITTQAANVYYVATNGSDSNDGLTINTPFRTIQKAVDTAPAGSIIYVRGGTYNQPVVIRTPNLTIESYQGETASIAIGLGTGTNAVWIMPTAHGTTLSKLDISGGIYALKLESSGKQGGYWYGVNNVTVKDCVLHHSEADVVKLSPGCDNAKFIRTEIHHSGMVQNVVEGIDNVNADNMLVQDCYIHDIRGNGIYPKGGSRNAIIERCIFKECTSSGISVGQSTGTEFFDADNPEFYENIDAIVRNNLVINANQAGIYICGALRPQIYNNTVINGGRNSHSGIFICPSVDDNHPWASTTDAIIRNNLVVMYNSNPAVLIYTHPTYGDFPSVAGSLIINNNHYYNTTGEVTFGDQPNNFYGNLAAWKAHGYDADSTEGDPLLDSTYHLTANSPCIDAGYDLGAELVADDFDKQKRPNGKGYDIGFDEFY